ncbi:MAG: transglutaminase-like cysteine peptidase [Colwellia sp.]
MALKTFLACFALFSCLMFANKILKQFNEPKLLARVYDVYGSNAQKNTQQWLKLLKTSGSDSSWNQLNKVNAFFNKKLTYQNDLTLWGKKDYWATPVESLGRGRGDCEDYAIAKFFSLVALGIPEDKLRLMYVRQLEINEPHMVLIYFEEPNAIPLVLDNYNPRIKPASQRRDLKPIYSFNGHGLWLAKAKGTGAKVKNSKGVSAWSHLIKKIEDGELNTYKS